ncbi:uncharacterized protein LOC125546231 [Triticum urartu]|nr:uncharacterized protein LOC125546231 [Triticum urartu]XP_048566349.1 uncharacterized protein LOC125546231 [Triticum urartu]XP_048566350.1 uncharacterized protein LOC125546231 [Triticum urartu]XP_048566352.1 uncharacterized protein LOC125546231 [Triticum urartu]XP_048566353.1 uncharacterized protein LOC125546231 [Triticum urartu]XP_048566354.1 uncharacterized protein LOC125546231 [Triticum urartu]XP_048566355.1 uncharacterized protein LOC125546231 [Triticum urartu]XP_048566356.1 uncharacte
MAGVQLDLLGNSSNKGGRGDKGGDNNQQSNEIAKFVVVAEWRRATGKRTTSTDMMRDVHIHHYYLLKWIIQTANLFMVEGVMPAKSSNSCSGATWNDWVYDIGWQYNSHADDNYFFDEDSVVVCGMCSTRNSSLLESFICIYQSTAGEEAD